MSDPVHLDSSAVHAALKARAGQTYMEMLDEVARLTAYAQTLETQLAAAQTATTETQPERGDAWGDDPSQGEST